jgi:hypothetical protein
VDYLLLDREAYEPDGAWDEVQRRLPAYRDILEPVGEFGGHVVLKVKLPPMLAGAEGSVGGKLRLGPSGAAPSPAGPVLELGPVSLPQ